jgi:trehalose 6-phosphate phosphatase
VKEQRLQKTLPTSIDLNEVALLLDVDGTLLDLAPTPREVYVPHSLRECLGQLWERTQGAVAFVSGRPLKELDLLFTPLQLPGVGGHGAEFRQTADDPILELTTQLDAKVKRRLALIAELGPGILVEDKGYSLALHYRLAPDKGPAVVAEVKAVCETLPPGMTEILPGRSVIEVKQVGFNKATGVQELMSRPPFAGRSPIFLGDDVTDESVFAIIPELAGLSFSVGRRVAGTDGCFESPHHVRTWLEHIATSRTAMVENFARMVR